MSPRKGGPSTEPLTEEEQALVESWIQRTIARDPFDRNVYLAKVVGTFYYTGMHPAVLARGDLYNLRCDGEWIRWNRTKTHQPIRFPVIPEIKSWIRGFLETLPTEHPITYNRRVHEAGRLIGLPDLTPRALRHTRAAVLMERTGFNTAKYLTGATDGVLIDYGKRAASKSDLARLAREGFKAG